MRLLDWNVQDCLLLFHRMDVNSSSSTATATTTNEPCCRPPAPPAPPIRVQPPRLLPPPSSETTPAAAAPLLPPADTPTEIVVLRRPARGVETPPLPPRGVDTPLPPQEVDTPPLPPQQVPSRAPHVEFKLVLLGDKRVGKTTFAQRFSSGETTYDATLDATIFPITFHTNHGSPVRLNVWHTNAMSSTKQEGYYAHAQCAIIMYDVHSLSTYKNVPCFYRDLLAWNGFKPIPTVLCANNKVGDTKSGETNATFHLKRQNMTFLDVSTKNDETLEKVFLWLTQQLIHFIKV